MLKQFWEELVRERYSRSGDNAKMKAFTFARNEEDLTDNSKMPTGTKLYFRSPSPSQNGLVLKFPILSIECGTAVARRLKQALDWRNNFGRITLFCTFPCCHCKTTTRKYLISLFMEDVKTKQRLSLTFPEPRHCLLQFNSRENCQHLLNWTRWSKRD